MKSFSKEEFVEYVKTLEFEELGDCAAFITQYYEYYVNTPQTPVEEKDLAFEKEHGMPMNYMELYKVLENFRKNDLELYSNKKTKKKSLFHPWFRPIK